MSWPEQENSKSKIRKRVCSSSSSSSLIRRYRFKRTILIAKKGSTSATTPVNPTWKMSTRSANNIYDHHERESKILLSSSSTPAPALLNSPMGHVVSVSARKLGATLWDTDGVSASSSPVLIDNEKKVIRTRKISHHDLGLSDPDPDPSAVSQRKNKSEADGTRKRILSAPNQKSQKTHSRLEEGLMEIEDHFQGMNHHKSKTGVKTRLKEVSNGLTTSKQLLKVLNHIWAYQDPDPSRSFVISALKMELDRARTQVDQLIKEQRLNRNKIEDLLKGFAEEKAEWRRKERDRIRDRVSCIASNLEVEKKLRKQTERVNKKLGKELSDTKALLSSALKEVERERRAKEIFEQVCDELARNIGEDRAQVEEVKKEIEKEREMLHLADLLREERVQMKLMEAKYHFEEKNEAVEMLKDELENYLRRTHLEKSGGHDHDHEGNEIEESPKFEKIKELEDYLRKINFGSSHILEKKGEEAEGEVSDDSDDGDLHSIELNMDNISKGYKWSFAFRNGNGNDQDDSKRSSVEVFRGRRSLSEKIQWGSVCLNRGTGSNGTTNNNGDVQNQQNSSDGFDWERFSELLSQMQTREEEDDQIQINRSSTKCLKDNMFSSPKVSSPTLQNG